MNRGLIIRPDVIINSAVVPITQATPKVIKIIAPTDSCFHEIIKITNKISEGILCINNPKTVPQKP